MKKIKIFISCHKECYTPEIECIYPIQVGAKIAKERFANMLHDDEGENISFKNKYYCELTAQYWVWKNQEADYYGFFHYRRYMSFLDQKLPTDPFENILIKYLNDEALSKLNLSDESISKLVEQYDIIATDEVDLKKLNRILKSNYHQYDITPYQYKEDLDILLEIIKEKYPNYYEGACSYLYSTKGYFCNMFIMNKVLFRKYSEWLFSILEEHEKRRDYSNYDRDAYRVSGYLGERLFGIYYNHIKKSGKYRCHELQRSLFENTDINKIVKPYFDTNNIVIALAANDYFIPYSATVIQSIIDNSSDNKNYDIIFLTHNVSDVNKKRIKQMISSYRNFSIRYVDPTELIEGYNFFIRGHFSLETYYRLVLPELLQEYEKIIYLDSDMIVKEDVAELYETDISEYLIAAALDADTAGLYNGYEPNKKEYTDKILKLKNPYNYFQAGTLVFNLKKFRDTYTTKEILEYAVSYNWQLLDQDILNVLCEGKVKYIDMSWNVMVDMEKRRIKDIIKLAPHWLNDLYMNARNHPKIIHYAGPEKPWLCPEMDMADDFWQYAKKTPYYEIMLYRMSMSTANIIYHEKMGIKRKFEWKLLPYGSRRREFIKKIYYKFIR